MQGFPRKIVGDRGTENVFLAAGQRFLRRNGNDPNAGENSFKYGRSIANQRIEGWWSFFRRTCTNWWMNYFKDLIAQGHYDTSDNMHVECIRFAYTPVLKAELIQLKRTWNSHRMRTSVNFDTDIRPAGRPNVLYFTPRDTVNNYKVIIDDEDIGIIKQLCCNDRTEDYFCTSEFYELAVILMNENEIVKER